jgi:hypothetical protein
VTTHTSHVTRHTSHVTRHTSHVNYYLDGYNFFVVQISQLLTPLVVVVHIRIKVDGCIIISRDKVRKWRRRWCWWWW